MADEEEQESTQEPLPYSEYPIIGYMKCYIEDCDVRIPIHARLKVGVYQHRNGGIPMLDFGADVFSDALELHIVEHGGQTRYYSTVEEWAADEEADDDE